MTTPKKLTPSDIEKRVGKFQTWTPSTKHDMLTQTFVFPSAVAALAFAAKITVHAELIQHHPIIELAEGKVKVKLSTTSVKGLTTKDFDLAKRIDGLRAA
jgi:4a-hydroxytetrahydrobiopterin dehydratase